MSPSSESTHLVLLRHGEVVGEWRGRIYGGHDVPLSRRGEEEARAAARGLAEVAFDEVVSSGLERTEFLARLLRETRGLPRRVDPGLREVDRGDWLGREVAALAAEEPEAWKAWCRTPSTAHAPAGESLTDLSARVLPRLDDWAARHAGGRVALVVHCWVIRVAVCHTLDLSLDCAPRLGIGTGEWVAIEWPAGSREEDGPAPDGRGGGVRPTLSGFAADALPPRGKGWFRGPRAR